MKKVLQISILLLFVLSSSIKHITAQNQSCLQFDGSNDYVKYNDDATLGRMDGATDYTIEAWVYPNSSTVAEYDRVLQRYYSFTIVMYDGNNDGNVEDWYFEIWDANGNAHYFNTEGDASLTLDAWNHIAVINNSTDGTLKLFVDGVDVTTSGGYSNMDLRPSQSGDNLYIGSKKGLTPNNSFGGRIDEVRLKNVAEDPGDLQDETTDPPYTSDSNTAGLFHFDEESGTTTVNEPSSTNATLNNGVTWITGSFGLPMDSGLPLDIQYFNAKTSENGAILSWKYKDNIISEAFEIQKSLNNKLWKKIGYVKNEKKKTDYSFIDNNPGETNYYRLKIVDPDGNYEFSKVVSLAYKDYGDINIFPNPVDDVIYVSGLKDSTPAEYAIYDTFGKKVQQAFTTGIIRLENNIPGLYFLQLKGKIHKFMVK